MNDSEDRPDLVDTLLRERARGHAEPDLTDAVLARLQRGEGAVQAGRLRWERATSPRRARAWLAAAVLLLGLGVVAAVAFTRREQEAVAVEPVAPETKGQDPVRQEPEPAPPDRTPSSASLPFALEVVGPKGGPVVEYEFDLLRVLRRDPAAYTHAGRFRIEPHVYGAKGEPGSNTYRISTLDRLFSDPPPDESIADGDYVVVVTDEMHARTTSEPFAVAKGTLPKVKVHMSAGVAFELHVATIPGKPIADVLVTTRRSLATRRVVRQDEMLLNFGDLGPALSVPNLLSTLRATSTASGAVSFRRVTPGTYRLVFEHPDYCTTVLDPVEVPLAAPLEPVRMIPGAVVRGTVKGSAEAIAGAKLTLSPKDGTTPSAGLWPMVTHANAKGEFAFDSHVPPGAYRMTPLREPSTAHVLSNAQGVVRDSVEVVVEEGKDVLEVALVCGAESSSSQQPAPDAKKPVEQDPAKVLPVAFMLRVVGPDGAPVPRMAVKLLSVLRTQPRSANYTRVMAFDELRRNSSAPELPPGVAVLETAANEREVRGSLNPGEYVVEVESEVHDRTMSQPFVIATGKPTPIVEVTMLPCNEVRLQLATQHGKPISNAVATTMPNRPDPFTAYLKPAGVRRMNLLSELRVESDTSGDAVLRCMASGTYYVRVEHPDYCTVVVGPFDVPLREPLEPVRMERGAQVRGSVLGAKEAIGAARLHLRPVTNSVVTEPDERVPPRIRSDFVPRNGTWPMIVDADASGAFVFPERVPPGAYVLTPLRTPTAENSRRNAAAAERDSIEFGVAADKAEIVLDVPMRDR